MINVGIVGISGYSGCTLLELLLKHKGVRLAYISANNTVGKIEDIWPQFKGLTKLSCDKFDTDKATEACDLVFLAVPHTVAMQIAPGLLKAKKKVIDLSGDYRLNDKDDYKKWYGADHADAKNLGKAVYGLPELFREDIKKADFISNPGCYPTGSILGLAPIVSTYGENIQNIIIDAKSGVSGAGRKATLNFSFSEVNENFKAYKVLNHQHAPEIDLYLSKVSKKPVSVNFVPHLLPITRGILSTIYISLAKKLSLEEVHKIYKNFYKTEQFVRVLPVGQQPELRYVQHTNYCDIAIAMNADQTLIAVTSAIDNLMKGASSQAVQNMNLMCGVKEEEGLL